MRSCSTSSYLLSHVCLALTGVLLWSCDCENNLVSSLFHFLHHFSKSLQLYLSIFIFEWPKMKCILFNIITNNLKTNCPRMLRIIFDSSSFSLILSFDRKLREDSIYFTICVWLTFNETTGKWNFKNSRELRTFIMHKC